MSLFNMLMLASGVITDPWDVSNRYSVTHSSYVGSNLKVNSEAASDLDMNWVAFYSSDIPSNGSTNYGIIRLFRKSAGLLVSSGTITRNGGDLTNSYFGKGVSISSDGLRLVCGSDEGGNGAVYLYTRSGTTWTLSQTITHPTGATGTYFSNPKMSLDGSTLIIMAPNVGTGVNVLFRYTWNGSQYVYQNSFAPRTAGGCSISAISSGGEYISVTEALSPGSETQVAIFKLVTGAYSRIQTIINPIPSIIGTVVYSGFGYDCAFSNNGNTYYLAGSPEYKIYRYTWNGSSFVKESDIVLDGPAFGIYVNNSDTFLSAWIAASPSGTKFFLKTGGVFTQVTSPPSGRLTVKNSAGTELINLVEYLGFGRNFYWLGEIQVYRK